MITGFKIDILINIH